MGARPDGEPERETREPLAEGLVDALADPAGHPRDPDAADGVEHVQTHLSHVFLLARRVYKLRKAVDLGFVDFSARARRNADCLNELRLNRRLAVDVYLGVAPVVREGDAWRVGDVDPDPVTLDPGLEHCVVMQRLEAGRDALSLLERGELDAPRLGRVADKIARFHDTLPAIETPGAGDVTGPAEANLHSIEEAGPDVVPTSEARALRAETEAVLTRLAPTFERRRHEGRVVEGHGDLHLQHVWFPTAGERTSPPAEPPIIDCLEFSESLRVTDVAAEVAFLAMDLAYRGEGGLAESFLGRYARARGDFDLYAVVDFYVSHRAAVRGKVAALAAADAEIDPQQRAGAAASAARHVALARRALRTRPPGDVVLVGGVIGTGKSTVARAIAERTGAVVIASDRVRKARLGLAPTDRLDAAPDTGAYTQEARGRVYDAMLALAAPVVSSGRTVVLDATWSSRAWRERARAFAADAASGRCVFVETRCDVDRLRARLEARRRRGDDPSDAGPELLDESLHRFEALDDDAWPAEARATVDTTNEDVDAAVETAVRTLGLGTASVWDEDARA